MHLKSFTQRFYELKTAKSSLVLTHFITAPYCLPHSKYRLLRLLLKRVLNIRQFCWYIRLDVISCNHITVKFLTMEKICILTWFWFYLEKVFKAFWAPKNLSRSDFLQKIDLSFFEKILRFIIINFIFIFKKIVFDVWDHVHKKFKFNDIKTLKRIPFGCRINKKLTWALCIRHMVD